MKDIDIFVSVGGTSNEKQENFVRSVEERLRIEGFNPHTVGRNTFSADAPLKTVSDLMQSCTGTVVLALERYYFSNGTEKRGGSKEKELLDLKLPTVWNQIEAAMAYSNQHPLLIIVEDGLKCEGLLEKGYDWYVQSVTTDSNSLKTNEFNGVLANWKAKVIKNSNSKKINTTKLVQKNPAEYTIGELITGLKPSQLWGLIAGIIVLVVGAISFGAKFIGE
jgi:hypothetical protein